jgi:hypothetical protein
VSCLRIVLGGLAAGVANMALGFAYAHATGAVEQLQSVLRDHGLRVIGQPSDAIPHVVVRLLMGVAVTALFAALAPRFGAGPLAALVAAGFAWAFLYAYTAWGHAHIGLFPVSMALTLAAWGAVEMIATALLGGWIATGSGFWSGGPTSPGS